MSFKPFNESTPKTAKTVYLFSGPHCGQCKMIKPGLEKDAASHPEYDIYEVDTSTSAGLAMAREYHVSMLPTVIVFREDGLHTKLSGAGQVNMRNILNS